MGKKIGVACDHAAYDMKELLVGYLVAKGYEVFDFGTNSPESVDYPDFAHQLSRSITDGEFPVGLALCGSGEGMAMTLNKYAKVRAALVWDAEIAELTRQHNDANVLVLPARFIDNDTAIACLDKFLSTEFEGGRHQGRVNKISCGC